MAFQISPGVNVSEIDLTDSVPQTATTAGGLVGIFSWGPLGLPDRVTTISTATELKDIFKEPTSDSFMSFMTAKNYLSYSRDLKVSRLYNTETTRNAVDSVPVATAETIHKFISFSNTGTGGVIQTNNNYVNDGVSLLPSSWSGTFGSEFTSSPYSMGSFFEGTSDSTPSHTIGTQYDVSGNPLASDGTTVSDTNVLTGVPTDWTGNFDHVLGQTTIFKTLDELVWVKLLTAYDYATGDSPLYGDTYNPWTIDVLGDDVRLSFADLPNLRKNPVGDVTSTWTDTTVSGELDVPGDLTTIVFGSSFGLSAVTGGTITVTSSGATPAVLTVTVTIDASGVSTIVVTAMTPGANLDLNTLTYDYSGLSSEASFTAVTGIEVGVPQRNTFNLPTAARDTGGSIKLFSGGSELSSVSQYGILPDSTTNEFIYITDTLYDSSVLREFILESVGASYNVRSATGVLVLNEDTVDGYTGDSIFAARYAGDFGNKLRVHLVDIDTIENSLFVDKLDMIFDNSDDLAVVVTQSDDTGYEDISEVFVNLSKSSGTSNWINTINAQSELIWVLGVPLSYRESPTQRNVWNSSLTGDVRSYVNLLASGDHKYILADGNNGDVNLSDWQTAMLPFRNKEVSDISLLFGSGDGLNLEDYKTFLLGLVDVAYSRKDIVSLLSPHITMSNSTEDVVTFFDSLRSNMGDHVMQTYAFADSNFKYQYDVFSDSYRWVPLCGDIAGVMSRTDEDRDPWFSPAGFNRGGIKNVTKLRFAQDRTDRDMLYKKSINPVCTFPGQGTILYGDKTFTRKSTSFDRINVRRLFIVLEKLIEAASNQTLFEFNDDFTRSQFVSMVEPFLRDVKGRRGIYDFKVVCDTTNNTPTVIDSNRFIGDIYIKPSRSINFIQLNFVAVATGIEFNEVVGKF
jgi:hypothetical protein